MMRAISHRYGSLCLLASLVAGPMAFAAPAPADPPPALSRVSTAAPLPHTQEFSLTSREGKDYRIFVSVPPGEPPPEGFGVMVVLDANAYFGTAAEAMGLLRQFPLMPEKGKLVDAAPTLVVGVGYPGDEAINGERRTWDFVPAARNPASLERLRGPQPGGADAFTDFLVDELRPAIASRYRTNPDRQTLAGHSLGGYYVLHALATRPEAFQRYVSASPAVWWDDSRILQDLAGLKPGKAQVLLAMAQEEWPGWPAGSAEMLDGARAVRDALTRAGLTGDALRYVELQSQDHMTTPFAIMPAATRFSSLP